MKEIQDFYFKKAKKENYFARSVYKLEEIQDKKKFLKSGHKIIELGAFPGSWSQYASKVVGEKGLVIGVDLQNRDYDIATNTPFICGDVFEIDKSVYQKYATEFDGIISDMAPNTTGNKSVDHLASYSLCEKSLFLSLELVKKNGYLLVKFFQGSEFQNLLKMLKEYYKIIEIIKPDSSRKESKEIFILALNKIN